jgi:hypothetical protein
VVDGFGVFAAVATPVSISAQDPKARGRRGPRLAGFHHGVQAKNRRNLNHHRSTAKHWRRLFSSDRFRTTGEEQGHRTTVTNNGQRLVRRIEHEHLVGHGD